MNKETTETMGLTNKAITEMMNRVIRREWCLVVSCVVLFVVSCGVFYLWCLVVSSGVLLYLVVSCSNFWCLICSIFWYVICSICKKPQDTTRKPPEGTTNRIPQEKIAMHETTCFLVFMICVIQISCFG